MDTGGETYIRRGIIKIITAGADNHTYRATELEHHANEDRR